MSDKKHPQPTDSLNVNGVTFAHADIFSVVDDFYTRIQKDPLLKVPFSSVHDWPEHIEKLTHFWWLRFGGRAYLFSEYNPVLKHFFAGFNDELLKRWLELFHETLKEHLNEDQCALWKNISERMGHALSQRNESLKAHYADNPELLAEKMGKKKT